MSDRNGATARIAVTPDGVAIVGSARASAWRLDSTVLIAVHDTRLKGTFTTELPDDITGASALLAWALEAERQAGLPVDDILDAVRGALGVSQTAA